jgi:hypothetical protein
MALAHLPGHLGRHDVDVPEATDALFDLPPEDFTVARDRLARRLRSAGRVEDAEGVKAMVRPTRAAWALNRVARRRPERVQALLASARELRVAQDASLAADTSAQLRAAQRDWRRRVLDLVGDAQQVLKGAGAASTAHVAPLTALAESVLADADQADALAAGRLTGVRAASPAGEPAEVITLDDHRTTVVRHRLDGSSDQRRASERDRLQAEQRDLHQRLRTVQLQAEEIAVEAAAADERLAEARRRLAQAEAAARTAGVERQRIERQLVAATRAARQVDQRLGQVDELLVARRRPLRHAP